MTASYGTFNIGTSPRVVLAGQPLVSPSAGITSLGYTLANNDEVNSIWIGESSSVTPADPGAVMIPPLGSAPLDPTTTTYAVSAGPTVQCFLFAGGGSWSPSPVQIATQIALKGINVNVSQYSMAPSGDATGVKDFNVFNGLIGITKVLTMAPGLYTFNAPWPALTIGQKIKGQGFGITVCQFLSTGDCIRFTQAGPYTGGSIGGGVNDMTIDGQLHAAGATCGLHAGDIESLDFDGLEIVNFNGVGDCGYHFDNTIFWTERLQGVMRSRNNTIGYHFDCSGASTSTGSFARPNVVLYYSCPVPTQNGVVVDNGANIYDLVMFAIMANHGAGASGTPGACLSIIGQVPAGHPGAGQGSRIIWGKNLIIGAESSAGSVFPQSINFGGAGNVINCGGSMTFSGFTPSNLVSSVATFKFNGQIDGDSTLPSGEYDGMNHQGSLPINGTIQSYSKKVVVNPAASATTGVVVAPGGNDGQELTIINVSTVNTITFAASGSNVAVGSALTIGAQQSIPLTWDASTSLWY